MRVYVNNGQTGQKCVFCKYTVKRGQTGVRHDGGGWMGGLFMHLGCLQDWMRENVVPDHGYVPPHKTREQLVQEEWERARSEIMADPSIYGVDEVVDERLV